METNNNRLANDNGKRHHTLMEELGETFSKLDTEFPLSGGETDEDLEQALEDDGKKPENHERTSFVSDLDTEFPLSGGEIER